ncbi:TMEM165/GDT1 family protein [Spirulina sp. CS-785/01]|uniref:TMEM165/GDT1 family protein n=1 Tax=Spirulina sp. CS-785/01 TaxID=3021716 RepID=UPI00232AC25A|nr:TMEM165/GDT1 family protein [Spirulina sp. CS-785/01]MDB9311726.1 TMEM165/GDT1 family protein [Spirulina sp. CS-785/01]
MLTAFTAALLLITISELGDKTFFIGVILATRYARRWVFLGVTFALAAMTILSVLAGQVLSFLPPIYLRYAEVLLFLGFGVKLLWDARQMSDTPCAEEETEALEAVEGVEQQRRRKRPLQVILEAFGLTFVAEWGDRTQIATIALAAAHPPLGVVSGAVLGHGICALIAVMGGRAIAQHLSEKRLTLLGGSLFLIFAATAAWRLA